MCKGEAGMVVKSHHYDHQLWILVHVHVTCCIVCMELCCASTVWGVWEGVVCCGECLCDTWCCSLGHCCVSLFSVLVFFQEVTKLSVP